MFLNKSATVPSKKSFITLIPEQQTRAINISFQIIFSDRYHLEKKTLLFVNFIIERPLLKKQIGANVKEL